MKYKINGSIKKNYGGGGGTSTVSSIPDWAQPYLQNVGNAAEAGYRSGDLGKVAGASELQQKAFGGGAQAIQNAAAGGTNALAQQQARLADVAKSGAYNTQALKDAAILSAGQETAKLGQSYGAGGTLGSARQAVAQGAQNAATAAQFATIDRDAAQKNFENERNFRQKSDLGIRNADALDAYRKGSLGIAQQNANTAANKEPHKTDLQLASEAQARIDEAFAAGTDPNINDYNLVKKYNAIKQIK